MAAYNTSILLPTYLLDFAAGDSGFILEMIDTYLQDTPRQLKILGEAEKIPDWEQVWKVAHKLLSSTRFMGAIAMVDIVTEIEHLGKASEVDAAKISVLIEELQSQYLLANEELKLMRSEYLESL